MRRKIGLFLVFGAVLPLAAASAAWACGVLATLTLDATVASPGQAITATGKNYSSAATASAVTIRLKSRTGRLLATTTPDASNKISTTFPIPANVSPGWYVVMATQYNANGTPKSGTPGRTTLRIQGSASSARHHAAAVSPWGPSGTSGPSASAPAAHDGGGLGGQSAITMALATLLSLTMLAAGWTLIARRGRSVPAAALSV